MEFKEALEKFKENIKTKLAYTHALGVMSFDSETVAPKNSVDGRVRTYRVLSEIMYKLDVNEEHFAVIDTLKANADKLDEITSREVELAEESLEQIRLIPMDEFIEHKGVLAQSHSIWVEAKKNDDYSLFAPILDKIISFHKRVASLIAPEKDPYEFWLDKYEKGMDTKTLDAFFDKVRASLVPLIKRISEKGDVIRNDFMKRHCPVELQRRFSDYIMEVMHINRDDCAIAETEHPFTMENNKHDVRITTHYYENDVASNMYSVIHEGGHALYELNIGDELTGTTLAGGTSMSVHEAQSRLYENIIGRSEVFIELIFPKIKELFPEQFKDVSSHDFYLAVNRVKPSLIRIEADELTYSLHIMVRYELEKRLIRGEISVDELPDEWNKLYKEYLGIEVPNNSVGVLQDVHWSGGMIGYFPSYALGSAYGAQIIECIKKELDYEKLIRENRIDVINEWLTERIYRYGKLLRPSDAVKKATGEEFDPRCYVDYLTKKFTEIYEL